MLGVVVVTTYTGARYLDDFSLYRRDLFYPIATAASIIALLGWV